ISATIVGNQLVRLLIPCRGVCRQEQVGPGPVYLWGCVSSSASSIASSWRPNSLPMADDLELTAVGLAPIEPDGAPAPLALLIRDLVGWKVLFGQVAVWIQTGANGRRTPRRGS